MGRPSGRLRKRIEVAPAHWGPSHSPNPTRKGLNPGRSDRAQSSETRNFATSPVSIHSPDQAKYFSATRIRLPLPSLFSCLKKITPDNLFQDFHGSAPTPN